VFNRLPVSARRLVSLCGERRMVLSAPGAGRRDHAAIRLSHRGCVTRVGFFPFEIQDSARFFPRTIWWPANSGIYAGKSKGAPQYLQCEGDRLHIGRAWFKLLRPDLAPRIEHLRDLHPEHLGLAQRGVCPAAWASCRPASPAARCRPSSAASPKPNATGWSGCFLSHEAPADGYAVSRRGAIRAVGNGARPALLDLLKTNDARGLGQLMSVFARRDASPVRPRATPGARSPRAARISSWRIGARNKPGGPDPGPGFPATMGAASRR